MKNLPVSSVATAFHFDELDSRQVQIKQNRFKSQSFTANQTLNLHFKNALNLHVIKLCIMYGSHGIPWGFQGFLGFQRFQRFHMGFLLAGWDSKYIPKYVYLTIP